MKNKLLAELHHFKLLSLTARQLLVSCTVYELAYPILFIFLSAYLFRNTGGFTASVLYNVGLFLSLPLAFFLNGLLLKRFPIQWMITVGLVGQGLVAGSVFFFESISLTTIFLMGFLQGLPMGLYWSNRNFVTLEATTDDNRAYYTGLEMIITTLVGIVSPFVTGWAIILGAKYSDYSIQEIYQLFAVIATAGLVAAGVSLFKAKIRNPVFNRLWLGMADPVWRKARLRELLVGIVNGLKIVFPALLTLYVLGQEGVLGSVMSAAAVFSAILLYVAARKANVNNRKSLLLFTVFINLLLTIPLALYFSKGTVLVYLMCLPTIMYLMWMAINPIQLKVIDEQDGGDPTNNYAYIVDRELFLNTGRLIGVGIFSALFLLVSETAGLRFAPLIIAILELGFLLVL